MRTESRLDALERLAASVEREIRRERARRQSEPASRRPAHRPPLRAPDDHGTERDYYPCRKREGGPCDLCKAAHALAERRRSAARRRAEREARKAESAEHMTIHDAKEHPEGATHGT